MSKVVAILSMLHEPIERHSGDRCFRGRSILQWTLERLQKSKSLSATAVLCWEDQIPRLVSLADQAGAYVLAKGPRLRLPEVESIAAACRWSDGWRGGLLGACAFDRGFYAPWALELAEKVEADAVVLVDPASALVDPALIDALLDHAARQPEQEICFAPSAPGLCGVFLRLPLLNRLAAAKLHPGRLLHYFPDRLSREMLGTDACLKIASPIARSPDRFTIDSDRQAARIELAMECLNGELPSAGAEELVRRMAATPGHHTLPRDVVVELAVSRISCPDFLPGRSQKIARPSLSVKLAEKLFAELAQCDDMRVTFAGIGDPLATENFPDIVAAARTAGLRTLQVETDLLCDDGLAINHLVHAGFDAVSVHLPALTAATYEKVMGLDGYARVLDNIYRFVAERQKVGTGLPLLIPIFTKCRDNIGEMEAWYDQWLRALNCAVIRGPSTFAGMIPNVAAADMTPPGRKPCARLASRLTVLSDGRIVSCEEDAAGAQTLGHLAADTLESVWRNRVAALRADHQVGHWANHPLCAACDEWHRP
jgi:hypothetical protein